MEANMDAGYSSTKRYLELFAGTSLLALPILLAITFTLHFTSLSDFANFQLARPIFSAEKLFQTLSGDDGGFRYFILPHLLGYLSLPLFLVSASAIAYASYSKRPKLTIVGLILTATGVIFLGGVFASWLSFAAIGNVNNVPAESLIISLDALMQLQGPLLISTVLSALTFFGMIILGLALHQTSILPRWSSLLYIAGNLVIVIFMDLDNWMLIGALMQCIGIYPLSLRFFAGFHYKNSQQQQTTTEMHHRMAGS